MPAWPLNNDPFYGAQTVVSSSLPLNRWVHNPFSFPRQGWEFLL